LSEASLPAIQLKTYVVKKTYMTYMFKNIMEAVCVRCFQHDKNEGKIAEMDYEIPSRKQS